MSSYGGGTRGARRSSGCLKVASSSTMLHSVLWRTMLRSVMWRTCSPGEDAVSWEWWCPDSNESRFIMLGEAKASEEGRGDIPAAAAAWACIAPAGREEEVTYRQQ